MDDKVEQVESVNESSPKTMNDENYRAILSIFEPMCHDVYRNVGILVNSQQDLNNQLKEIEKELDKLDIKQTKLRPMIDRMKTRIDRANANIHKNISEINNLKKKLLHLEDDVSNLYVKKNIQLSRAE